MSKEPPAGVTSVKPVDTVQASASFIAVLAMTKSTADVSAETLQSFGPGPAQAAIAGNEGLESNTDAVSTPLTAKAIQVNSEPETSIVMLSDERGVGATA